MFPSTSSWETLRLSGNKIHCSPRDQSLQGVLAMMTEQARKTSLENKRLRNNDYFAITPSCSHITMLTKNPATGLV